MVGPMTMTKVPKTRADSKYNDQPGTGRTGMYRIPPNNYDFYTEDEKCVRRLRLRPASRATRPRTSSPRRASRASAAASAAHDARAIVASRRRVAAASPRARRRERRASSTSSPRRVDVGFFFSSHSRSRRRRRLHPSPGTSPSARRAAGSCPSGNRSTNRPRSKRTLAASTRSVGSIWTR